MAAIPLLSGDGLDAHLRASPRPVLVDVWAPWCAACRAMTPVVEDLAADFAGEADVVMVDVSQDAAVAGRLRATTLPTFVVMKDNAEVGRLIGGQSRARLAALLEAHL